MDNSFIIPQGTKVDIDITGTNLLLGRERWRLGPVPTGDAQECRGEIEEHLGRGPEAWGNLLAMLDQDAYGEDFVLQLRACGFYCRRVDPTAKTHWQPAAPKAV